MDISTLIEDFLSQKIQSEAEVRSKLIVPLLELLGYSSNFRAEEFPVYGYEGGKALSTKKVDFLQFTSNGFDENRGKSDEELAWVYQHSLLVFEAKKPTERILVKGQPVFYSAWTRSIAYMISNGDIIEGYIVNSSYSDSCVFSCKVSEIPEKWEEINKLNFDCVMDIKDVAAERNQWANRDVYENYKNVMRVRCNEELITCVDRNLEEFEYKLSIIEKGEKKCLHDILNGECKIITSEPGGGKSYLMWMLMREYLIKCDINEDRIPIILEGRYYGKLYHSIADGIYEELKILIPSMTKAQIEKRIRQGGFVILFDALDEVENDYVSLVHNLCKLSRETTNTLIVTARIQNYKGEFPKSFEHYMLERLTDEKVIELLRHYSNEEMDISIHHIPRSLLEVIRTPLFLKMFVTVSKGKQMYKIPSNHAALFELYIAEKMRTLACSLYEETIIKSVLGKYALYSYENLDCTEKFFEILEQSCGRQDCEKLYELIWKTGLMSNGLQGIKYCHKAVHEFFVALTISTYDEKVLHDWLNENVSKEKYEEIICYLTGIISNKDKQNYVLDYLEKQNLPLFIKALKSRRNFKIPEQELNIEYAKSYYAQILKTYDVIIQTHFKAVENAFDGYEEGKSGKLCIYGEMDFESSAISMVIYYGSPEAKEIDVKVLSNSGEKLTSMDGKEIPIRASVLTIGKTHQRSYNLELLSYGFDSSREIAIDIIKRQLNEAMRNKVLFDVKIDVLLVEKLESLLQQRNQELGRNARTENLSLYDNTISEIMDSIEKDDKSDSKMEAIISLCKVLEMKKLNVDKFLDIKGDLELDEDRGVYQVDELYSDKMLLRKIYRIVDLSHKAICSVAKEMLPVLAINKKNLQMIGSVYRNQQESGIEYITVERAGEEYYNPIIEWNNVRVTNFPDYDEYFIRHLQEIHKTADDIKNSGSTVLWYFFDKEVFHNIIYKHIKSMIEKILGELR